MSQSPKDTPKVRLTSADNQERAAQLVGASHAHIAAFAQRCFASDGRGLVLVSFPAPPPGTAIITIPGAGYHTLEDLRRMASDLPDNEDMAISIRMVETYDPSRQAVVMATVGDGNPVTMKMKLDPPTLVDGPTSVQ